MSMESIEMEMEKRKGGGGGKGHGGAASIAANGESITLLLPSHPTLTWIQLC